MSTFGDFMIDEAVKRGTELDRLRDENSRLRAALRWYADNMGRSRSMDMRIITQDAGEHARAALNRKESL